MSKSYDLIVLGSGPGGYVAAIRAAQLGLSTAVVEKDPKFGGTCLHRGCIPTKALLHTASTLDEIRHAGRLGIEVGDPVVDMRQTQAYKEKVVTKNAKGIEFLFKKNKVDGIHGFGTLVGPNKIEVQRGGVAETYEAKHILIATGSVPREIPVAPTDGERIINSDHALQQERIPKSLVVLGAGAVGTEFASIFRSFGCEEVTLVEMMPRLLPVEDEDVSMELEKIFRKRGIKSLIETKLVEVTKTDSGVHLKLDRAGQDDELEAEQLLVAVGRAPVSSGIGLEKHGVNIERGYIEVDEFMRTSVPHIYAIGDVVDTPWLAHVASAEGILAVEHMAGYAGARPVNYDLVPGCTYCDPEVASVGLTEAQAKERGYDVSVGKFPFSALGKAGILQRPEGFVKVVRETKYDELLGVHIIGAHATDLIGEACVALNVETTNEELIRTMHAHPTLSEAVMEAAHAATGHAIHF